MKIRDQRDVANYLVIGAISISVLLASIPSLPLLTAPSIYTILFGIVLIALAVVSEGIAAFAAFKFFGMLELVMEKRKAAIARMLLALVVGVVALVGNGALVKIGLETANANFVTLQSVYEDQAQRSLQRAQEAEASAIAIRRGEAGALTATFVVEDVGQLQNQDNRSINTFERTARQEEAKANSMRMSAAILSERPTHLILLAILVLKFAEVTLIYLASPMARLQTEQGKLTNEERKELGLPLRGRPKLRIAN